MDNKKQVINKFALIFLCLVILELVLVGNQVESIKAIKKKIILKKLKKLIPLLALIKPKKKILLLPVSEVILDNRSAHNVNFIKLTSAVIIYISIAHTRFQYQ